MLKNMYMKLVMYMRPDFLFIKKNIFPERVRFVGFILMCMYMKLFMCHIEEYVYDCGEARG